MYSIFPFTRLALTEVFSSPKSHYTFLLEKHFAKNDLRENLKLFGMSSYGKEIVEKLSL
jgi:hypothetical protein